MTNIFARYTRWLHAQWPAGVVEKLPEANEDGSTNVPGVYIVGDLTGIPLLKFSAHSGARAVKTILKDPKFKRGDDKVLDIAIIGAGVSGVAAAMEAKKQGLRFKLFEASQIFSTVVNFPKGKPIYTYPTDMTPDGQLQFKAQVKEALVEEMEAQRKSAGIEPVMAHVERVEKKGDEILVHHGKGTEPTRAKRVIIAIGRSGNFRKIGCPGEDLDKVYNRLHDPKEYAGRQVLVVGGGDSALETAIALAGAGAFVTLSYRKKEFSRPKPGNVEMLQKLQRDPSAYVMVEKPTSERVSTAGGSSLRGNKPPGSLRLEMETTVAKITPTEAVLKKGGKEETIKNDIVFSMIGREAPLEFFRRSGIPIRGEWRPSTYLSFGLFFAFCVFVYLWKGGTSLNRVFSEKMWFPFNIPGTHWLSITLREPGFYYSLAYTLCVVIFGYRRIQRRRTPYVKLQTYSLMAFQVLPLFLLPYFLFPLLGAKGIFDHGFANWFADEFFPAVNYGHGREYWRAFGFVLAWPLFIWNFFTEKPMWGWLVVGSIQTFVIIPLIVWRWGKGAYCGWICSCGALAETLGDAHRAKMPHGPFWNRLNMVGQVILGVVGILFAARVITWISPIDSVKGFYYGLLSGWEFFGISLNYYHVVDIFLAGIVGVGLYFHFSGRVWCRFACPLAALMHIYARFSQFRIFAKKEKCISCNVCTSVCHQGIDIMNFANKGIPMEDPQCVRCSACVQNCPTGVLDFGRLGRAGEKVLDNLPASSVQMAEAKA